MGLGAALALPRSVGAVTQASSLARDFDADVATEWFDLVLALDQETVGFSPPVMARALGYLGVTLYEALVPGMADHRSLGGQLNDLAALPTAPNFYHWPTVANSALAEMIRKLFVRAPQARQEDVDALERYFAILAANAAPGSVFWDSIARGRQVAEQIYRWSEGDGGAKGDRNNFPKYERPQGPGAWSPTPPTFTPALQPYWGANRPFVLNPRLDYDPGPPPTYSEARDSSFYREALEVYAARGAPGSEEERIALFWSDDPRHTLTPPSHSMSIVTQVIRQHRLGLETAAEAYARAGIAVADAFIACWRTKYRYNLLRPITFIRTLIDPAWTSLVYTPPFPEYTSGHSAQSSAVAETLTHQLGNLAFEDHTHDRRRLESRRFRSFSQFAEEAAISRLYGGIHFPAAISRGLQQGREIGRAINRLNFRN